MTKLITPSRPGAEPPEIDFKESSHYSGPQESPGFLMWRTSTTWRRTIEATLEPLKLTHPQFVVMAAIGWLTRDKEAVSQVQIGRHIGLDPNSVSQLLRGLETRRLITRRQVALDRAKYPRLTISGHTLLKKAVIRVEAADERFFSVLGPDVTTAIELFSILMRHH